MRRDTDIFICWFRACANPKAILDVSYKYFIQHMLFEYLIYMMKINARPSDKSHEALFTWWSCSFSSGMFSFPFIFRNVNVILLHLSQKTLISVPQLTNFLVAGFPLRYYPHCSFQLWLFRLWIVALVKTMETVYKRVWCWRKSVNLDQLYSEEAGNTIINHSADV